ncbi:MAG TPA: AMP-binding protein [Nitriliruptorales bacterium]
MPHALDGGTGPDPRTVARTWVDSYPPGVPPTYGYPGVLLSRFLDDAVRDFPGTVALDAPGVSLSYRDLVDVVDRFAGALEGLGVDHRRPLGLLLDRGPGWAVACFASWRLGAAVVPVDPGLTDTEVHRRLARTGVRVLVTGPAGIDRVRSIRGALPALQRTIVTADGDWLPRIRRVLHRLRSRGTGTYRRVTARDDVLQLADLIDTVQPRRSPQRHADPTDTAAVLFDQAGEPLAFAHRHLVAAAFQSRLWVPDVQAGRERILVVGPSDDPHALVAGLLDPVLSAATVVIAPVGEPDAVAAAIESGRPTLLRGSAELFGKLAATSADLASLRACLAVTGSLDGDTVDRFAIATHGARLRRAYGPVAAAGLTHANPVYGRASVDAIGLPVSDTLACLVELDDPGALVQPGRTGRLLVRGPQVTRVRWAPPGEVPGTGPAAATQAGAMDGDDAGWFDTGDRACVDADGWFTLVTEDAASAHATGDQRASGGILTPGPEAAATDDEDAR